ncbi:hypothetical protein PCNPT3_11305 [Psychromonas sp. CNPT3]|uniref:NifB/NifX family molybdenum-iron cluster-binding protein n=1 Tax=Psychromonas sp. CNPT3 TaxID=314282 RepID=UPI00006E9E8F|nr:NifB/NifX family molybdenum-iron cluster-binding protein [Psychromonas sp. CNPT3]AGH82197.1 hypothetical protein PCNPT3_11305 [Psychromonas sp. CNPT3]
MSYVIALTGGKLAPRFSKAEIFEFYNTQKRKIAVYKNPALDVSGCAGKRLLVNLLIERQCKTVIVRKIGENTLAKLLQASIQVQQGNTRHNIDQLLDDAILETNLLTDASQGVPKKCNGHTEHKGCKGHAG